MQKLRHIKKEWKTSQLHETKNDEKIFQWGENEKDIKRKKEIKPPTTTQRRWEKKERRYQGRHKNS